MSAATISGRELDAKVAERVMGVKWRRVRLYGEIVRFLTTDDRYEEANGDEPIWNMHSVPDYSEDIASAFLVVEQMRGRGWHWKAVASCVAGEKYRAGFSVIGCVGDWHRQPEHEAAADTLPLAICLAALAALDSASPAEAPLPDSPSPSRGPQEQSNG